MVERSFRAPPQGEIPIPLLRRRLGNWLIPLCSSPISGLPDSDRHEYYTKKLSVGDSPLLSPKSRTVVCTIGFWTKSQYRPVRKRLMPRIRWFAAGDAAGLRAALARIRFLGRCTAWGAGRVANWTVECIERDYSWFAPSPDGENRILMRALPCGDWLPPNMIGYKRDYGAACSPYWHRDRYTEIVLPA